MGNSTTVATENGQFRAAVRLQVLGPVAAVDSSGRPLPLGPPRSRALLAALIVHAEQVLSVDRLTDLLWDGAPPATAATMVHGAVAGLRRSLEPRSGRAPAGVIVTGHGGYALAIGPEHIDAGRFEHLLTEGRQLLGTAPGRASRLLADGLALWRGPALCGIEAAFARDAAGRWEELRLEGIELRMEAELALGHHRDVVAELEGLVGRHRFRERLWGQLVTAQYRCGRQADALETVRTLRRALASELGLDPGPEIERLERAVLQHRAGLEGRGPARAGPPPGTLPAPYNAFVGRLRELDEIAALFGRHRLVTLTGPGGSGKSRLAVELARRVVDGGSAEVRLVDLARLTTAALVGETVAQAFGIRAGPGRGTLEAIAAALSGRNVMILLDNCEHLVEACAELVDALLTAATGVTLLVTGRAVLGVPGERVYAVGPLATAPAGARWEDVAGCESVRLFEERASAARPGFVVTPGNATLVLEVCRRLDGLPLALELAAARSASMPLAGLVERLDDRFRLLDSAVRSPADRHRGLAATLAWSYDLLSGPERLLFARVTVFPGSFTLPTAEDVVGDHQLPRRDVGLLLARLVAGSTVQMADGADGSTRYRLLETTREYGREKLDDASAAGLRARHARHFLDLAQAAQPHLLGATSASWLARLHTENDNLRAALAWSFGSGGDPQVGARLVACLWHPWDVRGARNEGLHWVDSALHAVGGAEPAVRLPLLSAGALFHLGRAEFAAVTQLTHELLGLARSTGAEGWAADALRMDATVAWARGRFDRAQHLYEDAVAASLAGGDLWRAGLAEAQLARLHRDRGEPDAARTWASRARTHADVTGEELARGLALDVLASVEQRWGDAATARRLVAGALDHYRVVGYAEGEASALHLAGRIALDAHEWESARRAFEQALTLCRRIGSPGGSAAALEGLARVAAAGADDERAGRLLGAAAALRQHLAHG